MKISLMCILVAVMISGCTGSSYINHKKGSKDYHNYCPGDVLVFIDKYGTQHICQT